MRFFDPSFRYHKIGGHAIDLEIQNEDLSQAGLQYSGYVSADGVWIVQCGETKTGVIWTYEMGKDMTEYASLWNEEGVYTGSKPTKRIDQL